MALTMQVAIIGLGKMGTAIARKLHTAGHDVIVWNRSPVKSSEFKVKSSLGELVQSLKKPRIVWVMVPHAAFDEVLVQLQKHLVRGDILIDGGNSFYKDTERRFQESRKSGIRFLGIGVSGGVHGEKNGYSLMAGGDKSGFEHIKSLLKTLSSPSGSFEYFGEGGAGHFVKMVHNGIEYGMMQSIGEGFDVLKNSSYKLDLAKVAKVYGKGAIVSGVLMDRTADVLADDIEQVQGVIEATGEAEWTVQSAKEEGVDVQIIEDSLEYRKRSKTDKKIQNSFTAKIIASLRNAFGGHSVKKK